jgi:hypothetical protein
MSMLLTPRGWPGSAEIAVRITSGRMETAPGARAVPQAADNHLRRQPISASGGFGA